ncbi:hypothetical protein EMN47_13335 [Prolixibacteraceae bacterium JC049]|nr:hypothetical protein [Prolixibacteraceae bacterium JC049]
MKRTLILTFSLLALFFTACDDDNIDQSEGKVEIYLITQSQKDTNGGYINEHSVKTEEKAFIAYNDLITYNKTTHTFQISEKAKTAIKALPQDGHATEFAIKVNNQTIYAGHLWASYSSAMCIGYSSDPISAIYSKKLNIQFRTPMNVNTVVKDKRNDQLILDIFEADNKLRD